MSSIKTKLVETAMVLGSAASAVTAQPAKSVALPTAQPGATNQINATTISPAERLAKAGLAQNADGTYAVLSAPSNTTSAPQGTVYTQHDLTEAVQKELAQREEAKIDANLTAVLNDLETQLLKANPSETARLSVNKDFVSRAINADLLTESGRRDFSKLLGEMVNQISDSDAKNAVANFKKEFDAGNVSEKSMTNLKEVLLDDDFSNAQNWLERNKGKLGLGLGLGLGALVGLYIAFRRMVESNSNAIK